MSLVGSSPQAGHRSGRSAGDGEAERPALPDWITALCGEYEGVKIVEADDFWKEFEVLRRLAEFDLNYYLRYQEVVSGSSARRGDPNEQPGDKAQPSKEAELLEKALMRMKVARDSAIGNLLGMKRIANFVTDVHQSSEPGVSRSAFVASAIWAAACSVSAFTAPSTLVTNGSIAGVFAGAAVLIFPPVRRAMHSRHLAQIQASIERLITIFRENNVSERNRADLAFSRFTTIKSVTDGFKSIADEISRASKAGGSAQSGFVEEE
ncbi:hypothetical protein B0T19DRAFT_425140 [Cercophora scortea]|uniref:Uncharacterized protein n=1 Tax=Cercophora scortea TaxID=314031 RepID=A0AAE0IPQ1_9PEZI|nr:hypothetical protein B0T19DRAFT_425140 [Cercophora scortea]